MKLCYFNDCKAGEYRLSLCCLDCDIYDCPERCPFKECTSCFWYKEADDYDKDKSRTIEEKSSVC